VYLENDNYLPTQRDGRLCFAGDGSYTGNVYNVWTTSWRQFKSDCHQTSSVIPFAKGGEVIEIWKVGGGGMRSTERPPS